MAVVVTLTDIFTIATNDVSILTKNKTDIFCCVSTKDSTVVEIWETSPQETGRNLIYSSKYTDFTTPSGASASDIVTAINNLINLS